MKTEEQSQIGHNNNTDMNNNNDKQVMLNTELVEYWELFKMQLRDNNDIKALCKAEASVLSNSFWGISKMFGNNLKS